MALSLLIRRFSLAVLRSARTQRRLGNRKLQQYNSWPEHRKVETTNQLFRSGPRHFENELERVMLPALRRQTPKITGSTSRGWRVQRTRTGSGLNFPVRLYIRGALVSTLYIVNVRDHTQNQVRIAQQLERLVRQVWSTHQVRITKVATERTIARSGKTMQPMTRFMLRSK